MEELVWFAHNRKHVTEAHDVPKAGAFGNMPSDPQTDTLRNTCGLAWQQRSPCAFVARSICEDYGEAKNKICHVIVLATEATTAISSLPRKSFSNLRKPCSLFLITRTHFMMLLSIKQPHAPCSLLQRSRNNTRSFTARDKKPIKQG
jgi:hypothetical protein